MRPDCMVPCFKCGKAVERVFESPLQPSEATTFQTYGHYGSTFWDAFAGEEIVVIICDDCLKAHADRIARHKRHVNIMAKDYSSNLDILVGRYWVKREPVPWFDGPEDDSGNIHVDPEQIGDEEIDGFPVEWVRSWREIKASLVDAARRWDAEHP